MEDTAADLEKDRSTKVPGTGNKTKSAATECMHTLGHFNGIGYSIVVSSSNRRLKGYGIIV